MMRHISMINDNTNHKVVITSINSMNFGSTGNIMLGIAGVTQKYGYRCLTYSSAGRTQRKEIQNNCFIGSITERFLCSKINYYTGNQSSLLYFGTIKLLGKLNEIRPDIIHLHNLHSNYINISLLFQYIKKHNIKVVWTLHDCWAFTGHCPHFDIVGCEKWKSHCYKCPMYSLYPATWKDNSRAMFKKKKELFTGVPQMVIATPSVWLENLVKQSFLKDYPVRVIHNGIDLTKFYPRESGFREKYGLENRFIIMGCAASWGIRKGLDRFEKLARQLDEKYKIVLVGIEQDQINGNNILCIGRVANQDQLTGIYSAADVFLNPTREDNFPTVNVEALACGTPVLSYGAGGSAEAFDEKSGMVVNDDNVVEILERLRLHNFSSEDCVARGQLFDQRRKFMEYVNLYDELLALNKKI